MKRLVFDLDETLCSARDRDYENAEPKLDVISKLREYKSQGFQIAISTSRNMRTFEGSVGKITAHTLPVILAWLDRHEVPYDEVHVAKPWCGDEGFYIDDRAIRPQEFLNLSYQQICVLLGIEE
jgi:capsule biosynthesis phosphatase